MVRNSQITKGVLLILVSDAVFCLMGVIIRYAREIDSYSKVFFRFAIGLSILAVAAMAGKIKLKFVADASLHTPYPDKGGTMFLGYPRKK